MQYSVPFPVKMARLKSLSLFKIDREQRTSVLVMYSGYPRSILIRIKGSI